MKVGPTENVLVEVVKLHICHSDKVDAFGDTSTCGPEGFKSGLPGSYSLHPH